MRILWMWAQQQQHQPTADPLPFDWREPHSNDFIIARHDRNPCIYNLFDTDFLRKTEAFVVFIEEQQQCDSVEN